jgi:hypothetical protein
MKKLASEKERGCRPPQIAKTPSMQAHFAEKKEN